MKKVFSIFMTVALLAAGAIMTGCNNKDNNNPDQPKEVKTYKMSIKASKGADDKANGPRRALGLEGNTLNATWAVGEQVRVYNETTGEDLGGYLTPDSNGETAYLSGTLTGEVTEGDRLTLKFLAPNYSSQAGTLAYIAANCDYAIAENIEVTSAENGIIGTEGTADFVNQQAIVKFRLIHEGDNPLNVTEFVITAGSNTYTVTPASATNVLYVAIPGYIGGMTFTATDGTNNYTHTKAVADLYNGHYYTTEIDMTLVPPAPAPAGYGPFSVSSTKQVYFSEGNLQYDSDTQGWQFAANQWDYIGNAAGNNAITSNGIADNNGIVDMFCWVGASSSLEGIKQYGIIKSWSGYGSVAGEALKSDWGNTMGGDWRTLSKDEWIYLLTERTNAANLRTLGTVNGKAGLILMPDGWTASGVSLTVTTANYTTNDINTTNWATLEGQGCAFLPAAGCCMSGLFDGVGGDGSYWSSTSRDSGSTHAHRLHFRATDVDPTDFVERFTGMSVRLVKDAD